jgi:hypothetical protein
MTPRRILLLMGGLFAFGAGLRLSTPGWSAGSTGCRCSRARMLEAADGTFRPPPRATSPTIERLKEAFGDNSPETEPAFYPTQLEFRNGDTSIVLAAGSPPSTPGVEPGHAPPFSVAIFGKPRSRRTWWPPAR